MPWKWKSSLVGQGIEFAIGPTLESGQVRMIADRSGLMRVIGNLLADAARFSQRRIVVEVIPSPSGVTIDVDDDGPGIPQADRIRIFDPFVLLEEADRGAGLGLALVKRVVSNHSGSVTALESPLGGCRVRTYWPVQARSRELAHVATSPSLPGSRPSEGAGFQ